MRLLLQGGVDQGDRQGVTALYAAAEHGHLAVVAALLEAAASVAQATLQGAAPLHVAARRGHRDIVAPWQRNGLRTARIVDVGAVFGRAPLEIEAFR